MTQAIAHLDYLTDKANTFLASLNYPQKPYIIFADRNEFEHRLGCFYSDANTIIFNASYFKFLCREYALLIILEEIFRYLQQDEDKSREIFARHFRKTWLMTPLTEINCTLQVLDFMRQQSLIPDFDSYLAIIHRNAVNIPGAGREQLSEVFLGTLCSIRQYYDTGKKVAIVPQLLPDCCLCLSVDLEHYSTSVNKVVLSPTQLEAWKSLQNPICLPDYAFFQQGDYLSRKFLEANAGNII